MLKETLQQFTQHQIDAIEKQLEYATAVLQNLTEDKLNTQPTGGGWSAAECIEHLNTYAAFYHPQLFAQKLPNAAVGEEYKQSWLASFLINSIDPNRPTKKMKAIKLHVPQRSIAAHQQIAQFIQHLEELLVWLQVNRNNNLNHSRITTSLSSLVKQTPAAIVKFLVLHNERHLRQAKKALD